MAEAKPYEPATETAAAVLLPDPEPWPEWSPVGTGPAEVVGEAGAL